jgi:hypothetical protein
MLRLPVVLSIASLLLALSACGPDGGSGTLLGVEPAAPEVWPGETIEFTATGAAASDERVAWSVREPSGGTIDAGGIYTAPGVEGTYHVVASLASLETAATTAVVVKRNVRVTVSPASATLAPGASVALTASVSGPAKAVTWSVAETNGGAVSSAGVYTAPQAAGVYSVVATSVADPRKSARATITVTPPPPPPPPPLSPPPAPLTPPPPPGGDPSGSPWFTLMSELYGDAGAVAQQRMSLNLLNGVTFHPTFTSGEQQFLTNTRAPFAYYSVPEQANIQSCYPGITDSGTAALLTNLTRQLGSKVWRFGMPEFDQGGGCWATGRPRLGGMSDVQAYDTWMGYYLDTKQFRSYLSQSAEQRGYKWMSACSFAFCTQYAFEMGADAVLLERNIDEVSGITPGLAMVRGAAKQHGGRDWGIDFSTWRYWNNGPTVYSGGRLVTGWSAATFKRNMFISYMGGANIIHNEAAEYHAGAASGSTLNPLGQAVQQFFNFAVTRHPDRGTPHVPIALMQDHYSGFEPKFGEWMQGDAKWYWTNRYTQGDMMFARLLGVAYPEYNTWGTLRNGAPKVLNSDGSINVSATQSAHRQALAGGADPRRWEPFGTSRWGETFDVITTRASLAALQRYRAVVLATGAPLSEALLATLTQYVQQGGVVVLNAKQLTAGAEALTGVRLTTGRASATGVTWVADGSALGERSYNYTVAAPTTATVVAQTSGNPIVTRNVVGSGAVYVTTPDFLMDAAATQILNVGQKLIETLQGQFAPVRVQGPPLEYLVSTDAGRVIVTLVNTDLNGAAWSGTLTFKQPGSTYSVEEWVLDATVASSAQGGTVVVSAAVPAYDVRVYVLDTR